MDCERYKDSITDAALGVLDSAREVGLQNHLASCAYCHAEFERERRLIGAIDQKITETLAVEPSADFVARIRLSVAQADIPSASLSGYGKVIRNLVIPSAARNLALQPDDLQDSSSPMAPRNDRLDGFFSSLPGSLWLGLRPRLWLAAAFIGVLAVGIPVWRIRRASLARPPAISVVNNVPPPVKITGMAAQNPRLEPTQRVAHLVKLRHPAQRVMARQIKRTPQVPQVLVEKDEAALVLDLYNAVRTGQVNGASLVAPPPGFKRQKDGSLVPVPLKIEPIEIAALDPEPAVKTFERQPN